MKIAFAGTPEFARVALAALLDAGFEPSLVLTQPDRPAGRGMALLPSPVKRLAQERGIEVFQPPTLRDAAAQEFLRRSPIDVMVVAAYGLILPQAVLDIPRRACLNIHASLLPRWRGAAPIQRAILAGDRETGVCIMRMEAGLDTGPVLLRQATPIGEADSAAVLHDRLATIGGQLIVAALRDLDRLPAEAQPPTGVTYAAKVDKVEAALDFARPAVELQRQIRAFDPFPGATAQRGGETFKLWAAQVVQGEGEPGEILAVGRDGIVVACGVGALSIGELQKPGGRRLSAAQFLAGTRLVAGECFALNDAG